MSKLPERIQRAVNRYQPVSVEGIVFYPILMDEYEVFAQTLPVLEFMPQTLPVDLAQIPLLEAFCKIETTGYLLREMGQKKTSEPSFEPLTLSILLLLLALRLGQGEKVKDRMERCMIEFEGDRMTGLVFRGNEGEAIKITPRLFQRLRPILAAQNGVEMIDEKANPEIVMAERQIAANKMPKMISDPVNRISWVAYKCHCAEEELYQWPIAKFNRRAEVIITDMNYQACQNGRHSGMVDFEKGGGSPFPSPYLRRDQEALKSIDIGSIGGGAAAKAVEEGLRGNNPTTKE